MNAVSKRSNQAESESDSAFFGYNLENFDVEVGVQNG